MFQSQVSSLMMKQFQESFLPPSYKQQRRVLILQQIEQIGEAYYELRTMGYGTACKYISMTLLLLSQVMTRYLLYFFVIWYME